MAFVQWVNTSFAVFDKKTGAVLLAPAGGNTIWDGFGGDCEDRNDGDPIVQYDQLADRWIMTQFSVRSGNYLQCVAISATDDATGAYHRYAFQYADFPDYPKLSVWPDAYYVTFNMFRNGRSFVGSRVCAYDRAAMLTGAAATQQCVQISNASLLVADLEGKTLPPAGAAAFVMNRGGATSLNLWRFRPNFTTPANSTFTGPTVIPVASHSTACGGGSCIPQPGTSTLLASLGDRLMYRLSYRNLGNNHEALLVNHSVAASGNRTGIRWYEIDVQGGAPSLHQQGTYAPDDGLYRWMGSAAMDKVGNIAVGYSVSSSQMRPSIRFAGRQPLDTEGILSAETEMKIGTGSQTGSLSRWGDYSSLTIDPVDDCTFWFTSEYLKNTGSFNWNTWIGSFKFSTCTGTSEPPPPASDFTIAATPASRSVAQGASTSFDVDIRPVNSYLGNGKYSVTGLPTGATGVFTPDTFSGGTGDSVLAITTASNTPTGSYPLTITATDGTNTHSTNVTLVVSAAVAGDFSLSASPGSRNLKAGEAATYTVTMSPVNGFSQPVSFAMTSAPPGLTGTFSPPSLSSAGTTTLTVQTTGAARGNYTLTITGTPQTGPARSVTVSLRIR